MTLAYITPIRLTNANGSTLPIGTPVYVSAAGSVNKAKADNATTAVCVGLVAPAAGIVTTASGVILGAGILSATTGQWDTITGGSGGLTFGVVYYLSDATAGKLVASTPGTYNVKVGVALSTTELAIGIVASAAAGGGGTSPNFGDGSDGDLVFDGAATVLGLVPSANVYTLDRNVHAGALTVSTGVTIKTASWAIYCTGTLTLTGKITAPGLNGSGITAGAAGAGAKYLPTTLAGGNGGSSGYGAPSNGANSAQAGGTDATKCKGGAGGLCGFGSGGGPGGLAGTITLATVGTPSVDVEDGFSSLRPISAGPSGGWTCGSGGGGGRGGNTGSGGGGGGGGGYVVVAARSWSGSGSLEAVGGTGGNGTGDGGGGGGGGGGVVVFATSQSDSPTISVAGGAGGSAGGVPANNGGDNTGGSVGVSGSSGLALVFR